MLHSPTDTCRVSFVACLIVMLVSACVEGDGGVGAGGEGVATISRTEYEAAHQLSVTGERLVCNSEIVPECAVSSAADVILLPGNRYVVHAGDLPVALIDSSGSILRHFGRPGQGPGEYRIAAALGRAPDGRVWIFDVWSQARVVFNADTPDSAEKIPTAISADLASFRAAGDRIVMHLVPPGSAAGDLVEGRFIAVDLEGSRHELAQLEVPAIRFTESDLSPPPGLFAARPSWAVLDDGTIAYSSGDNYVLRLLSPDRSALELTVDAEPERVTSDDIRQEVERARRKGGLAAQIMSERAARAAARYPAISSIIALDSGLVAVETDMGRSQDSVRWDILDVNKGNLIGFIRLGPGEAVLGGGLGDLLLLRLTPEGVARLVLGTAAALAQN